MGATYDGPLINFYGVSFDRAAREACRLGRMSGGSTRRFCADARDPIFWFRKALATERLTDHRGGRLGREDRDGHGQQQAEDQRRSEDTAQRSTGMERREHRAAFVEGP
jgi:hypothetical protein